MKIEELKRFNQILNVDTKNLKKCKEITNEFYSEDYLIEMLNNSTLLMNGSGEEQNKEDNVNYDLHKLENEMYILKLNSSTHIGGGILLYLIYDLDSILKILKEIENSIYTKFEYLIFKLEQMELEDFSFKYNLYPQQIDIVDVIGFALKNNKQNTFELRKEIQKEFKVFKNNILRTNEKSNQRTEGYIKTFCKAIGLKEKEHTLIEIVKKIISIENEISLDILKRTPFTSKKRRKKDTEKMLNAINVLKESLIDLKNQNEYTLKEKLDTKKVEKVLIEKNIEELKTKYKLTEEEINKMYKNSKRIKSFGKEEIFNKECKNIFKNSEIINVNFLEEGRIDNKIVLENGIELFMSYKSSNSNIVKNGGKGFIFMEKANTFALSLIQLSRKWEKNKNYLVNDIFVEEIKNIINSYNNSSLEEKEFILISNLNLKKEEPTIEITGGTKTLMEKVTIIKSEKMIKEEYELLTSIIKLKNISNSTINFDIKNKWFDKKEEKIIENKTGFSFRYKDGLKKSKSLCYDVKSSNSKGMSNIYIIAEDNLLISEKEIKTSTTQIDLNSYVVEVKEEISNV